jgi:hypothetical protein
VPWLDVEMRASGHHYPVALGVVLSLCGLVEGCSKNVAPGDADYPQVNPAPQHFVLMHGTIDPSLDVRFALAWGAQSEECRYAISRFAGVYGRYSAGGPLVIKPDAAGAFSVRIPIDGVLPGRCGWQFVGISYAGPTV